MVSGEQLLNLNCRCNFDVVSRVSFIFDGETKMGKTYATKTGQLPYTCTADKIKNWFSAHHAVHGKKNKFSLRNAKNNRKGSCPRRGRSGVVRGNPFPRRRPQRRHGDSHRALCFQPRGPKRHLHKTGPLADLQIMSLVFLPCFCFL